MLVFVPEPAVATRRLTPVLEAGVVAVGTLAAVAVHLQLWRAAWREPWVRGGDADFYLMVARSLGRHGSYLHNPSLGWPFGQHLADLPEGADNLHLLLLRLFAVLGRGPGAAVNLFFLATFATVAFTSHLVLRRLGCSRMASGVGAFIYAFAPYHFIRGEEHLLLSGYEMVPIGFLLALSLFDEPLPLLRERGRRGLQWRSGRTALVALAAICLASTGPYYFVFSMMLILLAGTLQSLGDRSWRPAASMGLIVGLGVLMFAVNVSPSLLMDLRHGTNTAVGQRSPFETQLYGLKISQLFIPRQAHRLDGLATAAQRSQGPIAAYQSEPGQQLGLLGAIALSVMLVAFALHAAGARRRAWLDERAATLVRRATVMAVACMLVGAIGGLSFLVSSAGLRQIRAWNRISVVIAFSTVVGLAVGFDRVTLSISRRLAGRPTRLRLAALGLATGLIVVAFADQGGSDTPPYTAIHAQYNSDAAFFAAVRQRLGAGAAVFNLPYQPFPEVSPRVGTGAYDEALGFIYQPTLNWSFGFMRGREPDYPRALESQAAPEWMTSIAAIGFTGIVLDRHGYSELDRARQEADISALAGPPTTSADGRYAFFDLRAYAETTKARLGPAGTAARAAQALALSTDTPGG